MLEIKKDERLNMHTDEGLLLMDFLESKGYRCIRVSDRSRANHGYEQGVTFRLPTAAVPSAPCPPNGIFCSCCCPVLLFTERET